ncbi:MAG: hypothetical protein RL166_957 [Actinomycetota bacterium]|jgi:uncharacterized membrane protein YhaH (DUF805 family)
MQFVNAIRFGFKNYFNFRGVVGRTTFWLWVLFALIVLLFDLLVLSNLVLTFAIVVPTTALHVRRLRDAGVSPGWLLLWLIPIIAAGPIFVGTFAFLLAGQTGGAIMAMGILGLVAGFAIALGLLLAVSAPVAIVLAVLLSKPTKA